MVRLDKEIAGLARQFVLVRIVNMRGVDLDTFDFDYDLTWAGFFLDGAGKVLGRYGGRDQAAADSHLSLKGLKQALREALAAHRSSPPARAPAKPKPARTVEQLPAATRLEKDACIHCHQVYDFRRDELQKAGQWRRENIWVYPPPENVGLTLEVDQGNRVRAVQAGSPAGRAGLRRGDILQRLNGLPVSSYADVQYALHRAPASGSIRVEWLRADRPAAVEVELPEGWRKSDISWRASMWGLPPPASVYGEDLTAAEKQKLGLSENRLAFRQGRYVPKPASTAGIRADDIIIGMDGKELEMTMLQFNVYVRLNYEVGDRITYNVIRDGQRVDVPMVLEARESF